MTSGKKVNNSEGFFKGPKMRAMARPPFAAGIKATARDSSKPMRAEPQSEHYKIQLPQCLPNA